MGRCVVVGGGPGGVMTAYLLGRAGVEVELLESHRDFDRDFRGDSLHPYTLELLDTLGLGDAVDALEQARATAFRFHTPAGTLVVADYRRLRTRRNYVALMPQARFLAFLAGEAERLPTCTVRTGARVTELLHADGDPDRAVIGVRYTDGEGVHHDVHADAVIGADGRNSKVRRLAGLTAVSLGATTDLLWFRLPRLPGDPPDADADLYFGRRHYAGLLGGHDSWQIGYSLPKGGYAEARDRGVEPLRQFVREHIPWLADRVELLTDFTQTTLLSVDISRVDDWHRPGLLLIGDAAHVISPVGGNGILMAIQDAVTTANLVAPALLQDNDVDAALREVQQQRLPAITTVQRSQARLERRAARNRATGRGIAPPYRLLRAITAIPGVRTRAAAANGYGPRPPRLRLAL